MYLKLYSATIAKNYYQFLRYVEVLKGEEIIPKVKFGSIFCRKYLCLRVGFSIPDAGERGEINCSRVSKYVLKCATSCPKTNESLKIYCRKSKGIS